MKTRLLRKLRRRARRNLRITTAHGRFFVERRVVDAITASPQWEQTGGGYKNLLAAIWDFREREYQMVMSGLFDRRRKIYPEKP